MSKRVEQQTNEGAYQRFRSLTERIVAVPKKEIAEKEKDAKPSPSDRRK